MTLLKPSVEELAKIARRLRQNAIIQARGKGDGYIGQALQCAELFSALFFYELDWSPREPEARDRFQLSVGHYAIAFYAMLGEKGLLNLEELGTYGQDGSELTLGGEPGAIAGMTFAGGSLGQGLGVAAGVAWGMRLQGLPGRVVNYMSDGEIQEGATWEAAMLIGARGLGNVWNIVDLNRIQADGDLVLEVEPLTDKFRAFGWWAQSVDGNDVAAVIDVFAKARAVADDTPCAIVAYTRLANGSPTIQARENAHFVRIPDQEWEIIENEVAAAK